MPKIFLAQFLLITFSLSLPSYKAQQVCVRLYTQFQLPQDRKASLSTQKAELRSPGQKARPPGFPDPLTRAIAVRPLAVFFNQALKKAPRGVGLPAAAGKLDGPTRAWLKTRLKKRVAIGYLYIWTEAATKATPANSGGAKGKVEAPGCLR